ncbi:MAG: VWA domain-containing protein, partial [Bacteroidales bacterium]|nr:VWA domain-containing protein [Bacteroidales bacterium]
MIHFQHPTLLYLLLALPLLLAAYLWATLKAKKRLEQFAEPDLAARLTPDYSRTRQWLKRSLVLLATALLIVAAANPQIGTRMVKGERMGSDVAICLDVSKSMAAEDIQPNRLDRGKRTLTNLLAELGGDRISLVIFAGSAYIQMPLTNDYSAAKLFLEQVNTSMIDQQGTAIGEAIDKAMATFGYGDPDREWQRNAGRAIVVVSDGENHEDDAVEAARKAAAEGVMVCTIGMGTEEGAPIPQYNNAHQRTGYKTDRDGNVVTTRINSQMLTDIAHAGKGIYVRAGNLNSGVAEIARQIRRLEKESYDETMFSDYESCYQYPLWAALACLLLELFIFERRNMRLALERMITRNNIAILLLALFTAALPLAANAQSHSDKSASRTTTRQGNRAYNNKQYDKAETRYHHALHSDTTYGKAHYNLGNTLYRRKDYHAAAKSYDQALHSGNLSNKEREQAYYNMGTSLLMQAIASRQTDSFDVQSCQRAIDCFKDALRLNGDNDSALHNLAYATRLMPPPQQGGGGGGGNNNKDQQDKKDQQQQ